MKANTTLKKGDIVWASLSGHGSVQSGRRPCVVLGNEKSLKYSNVVQVIPISSKLKKVNLPVHIIIEEGLPKKSLLLVEQIQTIPQDNIGQYITNVGNEMLVGIEKAVKTQLGF